MCCVDVPIEGKFSCSLPFEIIQVALAGEAMEFSCRDFSRYHAPCVVGNAIRHLSNEFPKFVLRFFNLDSRNDKLAA